MPKVSPRLGTGKTPGSWREIKDPILRRKEYIRQYRAMKYEKEKTDPHYVEMARIRASEWYNKNKDRHAASCSIWRMNNKEKDSKYRKLLFKKYKEKNPEKFLSYSSRRRALKNRGIHPQHDFIKEMELISASIKISKETGIPHAIDHIIPLSKGGWHHHDNLQILPRSVNSSKHAKLMWESGLYKTWKDVPEFLWPEQLVEELKKQNKL